MSTDIVFPPSDRGDSSKYNLMFCWQLILYMATSLWSPDHRIDIWFFFKTRCYKVESTHLSRLSLYAAPQVSLPNITAQLYYFLCGWINIYSHASIYERKPSHKCDGYNRKGEFWMGYSTRMRRSGVCKLLSIWCIFVSVYSFFPNNFRRLENFHSLNSLV